MTSIRFSGSFHTDADAGRVIEFASSHSSLLSVIPDVESHRFENGVSRVRFKIDLEKIGGEIAGNYLSTATASMKFEISRPTAGSVLIQGSGRALGSSLKAEIVLEVAHTAEGSDVSWNAEMDVGVLLKLVGKSMVDAYSADAVRRIVDNLKTALKHLR